MKPEALKRSITIFCPDSHLSYDRSILDQKGVGGGITTRVRMAYALAARGHRVKLYINCPRERMEKGVETRHFSALKLDTSDIFIASTSGGNFNLSSLGDVKMQNRMKVLLVHGISRPKGLSAFPFDFAYAPSNFIRTKAVADWSLAPDGVFVSHRGVTETNYAKRSRSLSIRDPYALLYTGHPSKGLETAISILRSLRAEDPRFHLHVYGDAGLWGELPDRPLPEVGVTFHGIHGQLQLAREIQGCSFSLNLQTIQDSFGLAVIEAMHAGCIVMASPVGAFPEIVTHARDGFLIPGDPSDASTCLAATGLILALVGNPEYASYIRRNSVQAPLSWDTVARTWEGHWDWHLSGRQNLADPVLGKCLECRGEWLPLADGLHCIQCGNYQKYSSPVAF